MAASVTPARPATAHQVARYLRTTLAATAGGLAITDIATAAVLSGVVIAVAAGVLRVHGPHASTIALLAVLTMTVPVAWRRRWPLSAAAVLVVATVANGLIFGPLVRCGVALPADFLVAFAVGLRYSRLKSAAGLLVCGAAVITEGFSDPHIEGPGLIFVVPVLVAFFAAGRVVRARAEVAGELRRKSAELRGQREQSAQLAVLADRAQLSADLEQTLRTQVDGIAGAAAQGLRLIDSDQDAARQVMASIEQDGRDLLGQMREVLGRMRQPADNEPQPTLARLPDLLATATTAQARLIVDGSPRVLPAGVELSGYRIIEHLLLTLDDTEGAIVEVRLLYAQDALELQVSGPPSVTSDLRAVLAAAAERASLHNGSVRGAMIGRRYRATARLPLISSHA